ncbi:T9SS type A sorting domain-containing protein, partial [bacterium]|nr:T9SS type A sorting domain-containing protein [bacterium]
TPFLAHEDVGDKRPLPDTVATGYPQAALNDEGILVVTWVRGVVTAHMQPRYQVFDADDNPIDWEALGHRVDNGDSLAGACAPKPFWLDNDRFVVFWTDYCAPRPTPNLPWFARVFDDRGLAHQSICTVMWGDSLHTGPSKTPFSMSVSSDDKFSCTYNRSYWYPIDTLWPQSHSWEHQAGFLGGIVGNEPWRNTTVFEYSPAYGSDTVWSAIWDSRYSFRLYLQVPAVACSDDRIVWVYTRFQTDTVFEAYAIVSDWDMGVGVAEEPETSGETRDLSPLSVTPIGSTITLSYSSCPNGFSAYVYDASGRKVDELHSTQSEGTIEWGEYHGPGVYFIKLSMLNKSTTVKVLIIK